ncbi:serine dehydratase subunit alpha family protein [Mesotoga sp.]|jgi:L-cysteine desulfidase|uniref:L-cysteine desulfidase family protein n=1 Tax=Mesotoga sp. TaxID=2053577 RepID=UPI00345E90FB
MRFLEEYLETEVKPALGCTEPGAVAFCTATAASKLKGSIRRISVVTSVSIYKNGMYVGIPGTNEKGNEFAAALGAICGDAALQLEALKPCRIESVESARKLIEDGAISVRCDPDRTGVFIQAVVEDENHVVRCTISGSHTNVSMIEIDGMPLPIEEQAIPSATIDFAPDEVFDSVEAINNREIGKIFEGIDMNLDIARFGLDKILSSREGSSYNEEGLGYKIRRYCLAASAARMSGAPLPVMSSGGSGNQGIVTTLPVALTGLHFEKRKEDIAKAVAISHLFSGYIKKKLGRVAPICGCVTAAGTGATAGIVYLLGGSRQHIEQAMLTILSSTTGIMCDGAKEGCALKAGLGGHEAYCSAMLSLNNLGIDSDQGFIAPTLDRSIENIQLLLSKGMSNIDSAIVEVLENRKNRM